MKVSIVVPSKGCKYLSYLLTSLKNQSIKGFEVILIVKDCSIKYVEKLCQKYTLVCTIIEQKTGYFTHALNMGKREVRGDIVIFTDDDVIALKRWVERYVKLWQVSLVEIFI